MACETRTEHVGLFSDGGTRELFAVIEPPLPNFDLYHRCDCDIGMVRRLAGLQGESQPALHGPPWT
jgi:hypothetical protein